MAMRQIRFVLLRILINLPPPTLLSAIDRFLQESNLSKYSSFKYLLKEFKPKEIIFFLLEFVHRNYFVAVIIVISLQILVLPILMLNKRELEVWSIL
jgi:hypothetical protein